MSIAVRGERGAGAKRYHPYVPGEMGSPSAMEIIDNINRLLGDDLKRTLVPGAKLKVAASSFSIFAYEALKAELEQIEGLEFIFTAPTFVANEVGSGVADQFRRERREFHIPKMAREREFFGSEFEIRLKNKLTQKAVARECADWIRRKTRFRSNNGTAPMQQFLCVDGAKPAVYSPISGFTAVELGYQPGNAVSSMLVRMDEQPMTATWLNLFEQIWQDTTRLEDVTTRLCEHIDSVYQENSPERIYFLILYNIFNEFLEDISADVLPNDRTGYQDSLIWKKLFNFQRDAATGIINKLETYSGCILADSVGLGKTFTALAVIKYYELRNRNVLVLCPKKLADNWLNYNRNVTTNIFGKDRFNYDVLCHTDLQRTRGESFGMRLNQVNWGNYDLVVIDESHNFRNNDAYNERETRYQKLMNRVIKAGVKTKVLMLSATPVNNRFNDLRNQLALAYEGDPENLSSKLRTDKDINGIFRRAQAAFNTWSARPPEERTAAAILGTLDFDFFELLDSVTIARSRRHIETFYDTTEIGKFPQRLKPISIHCPLTQRGDVIGFNEIFDRLTLLTLGVYAPISYILPSRMAKYEALYDTELKGGLGRFRQRDRERSLQALMTVNLLKRLESSVEAFRLTLQRLAAHHLATLRKIAAFQESGRDLGIVDAGARLGRKLEDEDSEAEDVLEMSPDTDADSEEGDEGDLLGGKVRISLSDMDVPRWENDLRGDLALIDFLLAEMRKIGPGDDAKLQHLRTQIFSKLASPINPGNRKVLIFTAFADTANYLYEHLALPLLKSHNLHTGKVTGADSPKSTLGPGRDFQTLLTLFSPRSKEKAAVLPHETGEIDILIGTDCISEGQNLQDCDYLINYDIHWNPVRIIQRFGRIDRIGSQNACIQLVNYWPDITLDEYINLKQRVENRMVIADMTATGDDNPLDSKANDLSYRKEQLRRLQDEVIEMEDLKTGVSITDLGLNDFRMDLLNYMKEHGDLAGVPNGMHAVVLADAERGLVPGVIFALRNRSLRKRNPQAEDAALLQQNRLHPYYLIYMSSDARPGRVVVNQTEVKRLLDLLRTACKGCKEPVSAAYRLFNRATDDGRNMQACSNLLADAIRSMVALNEEKELDSLFLGPRTTALVNTIQGLDDFELIGFLAVVE